jgi:Mrp family chromosome partitioning ATPase/capsular polysaccharide biosynthesis protein
MTFAQYLNALKKRWKFIVICVVLLGAGAYFGSKLMKPAYQSAALVQIGFSSAGNQSDYTSLLAATQLLQTETTLATSDAVLREAASHFPGLTASVLAKEVSASPKVNTQLFEIDVQDPSQVRAAALANDIANTLIQQQTQAEQSSFLYLVQPAQPASTPVQPNVRIDTAIGLLAGLLLALALVLLFEQLDPHIRTPEEITSILDWPVLASISQVGPKEEVVGPAQRSANADALRILRTNIGFAQTRKPLRTILVTSATSGEGKSVIAANLALCMARAGRNTLLIEADLRRPSLQERFDIPSDALGFSNAILELSTSSGIQTPAGRRHATQGASSQTTAAPSEGEVSLDRFMHTVDANLCLMPSGPLPPNPAELLDSKGMRRFLRALDDCGADVIIFDAPPLLDLSDARILASRLDGTLVVIDVTVGKKSSLKQVKAILEQAGADVLGLVVNRGPHRPHRATYADYERTANKRPRRRNEHAALQTPGSAKGPQTKPQHEDVSATTTVQLISPHVVADKRSRPELSNGKGRHIPSAHAEQAEAPGRPDPLDGGKDGDSSERVSVEDGPS